MVWYGNASTCSSPSNHDDDDNATQHCLSACACAYVVDEEEEDEEQELEQEEEGEKGEVDNQPRPRSRRLFFHVGSGVHGNETNRHTNSTHPSRRHHHHHCCSPIPLFVYFAAATPAPALDRARVESRRAALHSSRDASRHDATRDDTRRYAPAALCNAIMQCNAMRSNPPRTARVSARGPDTRRWREQACVRVEEAGMGIGMGMVRIPKSHVQK
jgi:hypothetical protein